MNSKHRLASPGVFWLLRLEYWVGFLACVGLALANAGAIRWGVFIALFVIIDAVGYVPGAIAYRRRRNGETPRVYYALYNLAHSFVFAAVVAGIWALSIGAEWALLALPIHLCADRSIFGNLPKSSREAFEPESTPALDMLEATWVPNARIKEAV